MEDLLNPQSEQAQENVQDTNNEVTNIDNTSSIEEANISNEVTSNNENLDEPTNETVTNDTIAVSEEEKIVTDNEKQEAIESSSTNTEEAFSEEAIPETIFDNLSKEEVTQTLEDLVKNANVVEIKKQVSLLRSRFLQLLKEDKEQALQAFLANDGNREDFKYEPDEVAKRFDKAFGLYKEAKIRYNEELEKEKEKNLAKKQALLEELRSLIDSEEMLKQIYDRFKEIQETWKEIGPVPQANVSDLWQNYHFYVEQFFNKIKINRELKSLDMKKNLEKKVELCEKAEALILESSIVKSFKLLQEYHQEWKEIGAVEDDKREELWNRFKDASDKINQKRRDYYDEMEKQQESNYQQKLALCEQLDSILASNYLSGIKAATDAEEKVNNLFKTWRTLGPAPKAVHDEIWTRFRNGLNTFFDTKKEFLKKSKEEQVNNYNMKVNLCLQAEAIAIRNDWRKATRELLQLQEEWKKIGPVSRKQSEALWTRFRKACDDFFAAKADFYKDITQNVADNLAKKEELIQKVKDYQFVENHDANFEALKGFQREWTSIGYTPQNDRNRVWEEFRAAVNQRFEELRTLLSTENKEKFISHIAELKENEDGESLLKKERRALQTKIAKMMEDVALWENNLGFFAKSKNSEVLKVQFEEKIANTKKEIAALKEKLNLLNNEIKH